MAHVDNQELSNSFIRAKGKPESCLSPSSGEKHLVISSLSSPKYYSDEKPKPKVSRPLTLGLFHSLIIFKLQRYHCSDFTIFQGEGFVPLKGNGKKESERAKILVFSFLVFLIYESIFVLFHFKFFEVLVFPRHIYFLKESAFQYYVTLHSIKYNLSVFLLFFIVILFWLRMVDSIFCSQQI